MDIIDVSDSNNNGSMGDLGGHVVQRGAKRKRVQEPPGLPDPLLEASRRRIRPEEWNALANGKALEDGLLYIGRGGRGVLESKWANPFRVARFGRQGSIDKFKAYYRARHLEKQISDLAGMTLLCHCTSEEACHGDFLVEEVAKKSLSDQVQNELTGFVDDGLPTRCQEPEPPPCQASQTPFLQPGGGGRGRHAWPSALVARNPLPMGAGSARQDAGLQKNACFPAPWPTGSARQRS